MGNNEGFAIVLLFCADTKNKYRGQTHPFIETKESVTGVAFLYTYSPFGQLVLPRIATTVTITEKNKQWGG